MAKSKSKIPVTVNVTEKKPINPIVNQFYAIRAEVRKVTWPTREEARALTIAVTVGTIVIAIFLFLIDLLFEGIVTGVVGGSIPWIVTGVMALALVVVAFYMNGREE
jgi:preprotein translocase SecE subunit